MADYNPFADELEEPASHNRRVALIISVLALLLTLADILGQSALTRALQSNIEASNIWSFYQAKHMRETALKIAADEMETNLIGVNDDQRRKAMQQRIANGGPPHRTMRAIPQPKRGARSSRSVQKKRSAFVTRPNNNTIAMSWRRVRSRSGSWHRIDHHRGLASPLGRLGLAGLGLLFVFLGMVN